ncbi:MAG: hydroxyacylglutathione hydrolase [Legionellales bacterium]|jgi:hydroxyacylglutathione hydrolase|nr:hydroxyacylglutathione hydrolase [Legionellales bacterium]
MLTNNNIKVTPIKALTDNYIWAIESNNYLVVVDPGEAKPVIEYIKKHNLNLAAILVTHHHYDHTGGIAEILAFKETKVWGPVNESIPNISNPVENNDIIEIPLLDLKFQVLAIPGHTIDHIAYYGSSNLFCGDTLFTAGMGRIFEGTAEQMYNSMQIIKSLPNTTNIYCGHEYTLANLKFAMLVEPHNLEIQKRYEEAKLLRKQNLPTVPAILSTELATNPFLRTDNNTVIESLVKNRKIIPQDKIAIFRELRAWKDTTG